jgi:hypothetical protein
LDQLNECLHDSPFIRVVFFGLRSKPIPRDLVRKLSAAICARSATLGDFNAPLSSISPKLAYVSSTKVAGTTELLP